MVAERSPLVRRRELGALLRELRHRSDLTVDQVAQKLLCSATKVSRMETGRRPATLRDLRDLCEIYEVADPDLRAHLVNLADEASQPAWWHKYNVPYTRYIGLEADAAEIFSFEAACIPGLLQTAEYAKAMLRGERPKGPAADLQQRLEIRLTRQRLLTGDNPPQVSFVLDEAVVRRNVGGSEIMRAQLEKVVEAAKLPHVVVQVLDFAAGAHPAMPGSFVILRFTKPVVPDVVYLDHLVGDIYLEREQELARYQRAFEQIRSAAMTPDESVAFLSTAAREYKAS